MTYTHSTAHTIQIAASAAQTIHSFMPSSHGRHSAKLPLSAERKMSLSARILERFRKRLTRWVEKERLACGCATTAVKKVSGKLKMSPATIYRVMNGYGEVQIKATHHVALLMYSLGTGRIAEKFRRRHRSAELHA